MQWTSSDFQWKRDFLDLPLVGNVEPLIEHDFAAGELRWTVFDFLHARLACQEHVYSYTGYFPWMLLQLQQTDTTGPSWEFSGHTGCRPDQNTAWNLELMAIQRLYKERSFRCNSSSILISLLIISERAFMRNQFGCLLFSQCFRAGVFSSLSPPRSFDLPRFLLFVGVSTCHSHEQSFFLKSRWSVKWLHASC